MRTRKLTLAASVAATLAAPAFAQSSVQVYGKLYPYVVSEKGSGATAAGTPVATFAAKPTGENAVDNQGLAAGNSRLGFRGKEDLGGGLKALFQLEGTVAVDGNAASGFMFNRDTYVGLSGGFGTVKLGNLDTIFKTYGDTLGILGLSSGTFLSTSEQMRKSGFGTSSSSSFHLRRANSIQYESPKMAGFQVGAQYATDEKPPTDFVRPHLLSLGAKYDAGPVYLGLAHEIHSDYFGGSNNAPTSMRNTGAADRVHSKDNATQATVEWRIDKQHKVEFDVIRKNYDEDAIATGRFKSYTNTAYMFAWENRWTSNFRTAGHIVRANDGSCTRVNATCNTDGLASTKFLLAAGYYFSKRTMVFAAASLTRNGKSARFLSSELGSKANPGEDVRQLALGISHSF